MSADLKPDNTPRKIPRPDVDIVRDVPNRRVYADEGSYVLSFEKMVRDIWEMTFSWEGKKLELDVTWIQSGGLFSPMALLLDRAVFVGADEKFSSINEFNSVFDIIAACLEKYVPSTLDRKCYAYPDYKHHVTVWPHNIQDLLTQDSYRRAEMSNCGGVL